MSCAQGNTDCNKNPLKVAVNKSKKQRKEDCRYIKQVVRMSPASYCSRDFDLRKWCTFDLLFDIVIVDRGNKLNTSTVLDGFGRMNQFVYLNSVLDNTVAV